ncbi:MAG: aminotransferase class V-fold PLP-dependent enzyme [Clostridia bacterium]|nr:aminotransferase class V-fold PLP-dependent enzyme [Clostridia bacterium]
MIYLDNAATSFVKPAQVACAVYNTMIKYGANAGRGGHKLSREAGDILYDARENLCRLFNINDIERLAFCPNTTYALNMGIKGVLDKGNHVIITSMEHNSVLRPIETLRTLGNVAYTIVRANEKGELLMSSLKKAIRPETKLIVMTHASNVCGNVFDIYNVANLAHEHGILFMVDAAQSAGILDIDASKVDLLAFPGHKGLMGPQGTGGLYVRKGIGLYTIVEGGTGSSSELFSQPEEYPDRLESGTQNVPAIAGLNEGVKFILSEGINTIRQKEEMLTRHFISEIKNINKIKIYGTQNQKSRVGVVALNISGRDCVEVCSELDREYDIAVRGGLHCSVLAHETLGTKDIGCVRFSFGYFNAMQDVNKAVYALYKITKK